MIRFLFLFSLWIMPGYSLSGNCDYSWQRDSAGRRCGGRAASVRPGGNLGGNGKYIDSQGRHRIYGRDNDPYDKDYDNEESNFDRETGFQ